MSDRLHIKIVSSEALSDPDKRAIISLCNLAYEEDLEPLFNTFVDATHVLGTFRGSLVGHALWVTRWLQPGNEAPLRTAYVEAMATHPDFRRRGFAAQIMTALGEAIRSFELGALCPDLGIADLYEKLGWEFWRGPLSIRAGQGLLPTPDERVMILRLPKTPALHLEAPLSAEWREGELW